LLLCGLGGVWTGCAHKTVIRSVPEGAEVFIDDEPVGEAPVVVERYLGVGGEMRVRADLESFQSHETLVERTDWFLWPALFAATPLMGLPTLLVPFAGPFICGGWAIVTSPTLISLFFLRKFPDEVTLTLTPNLGVEDGAPLPTDDWMVPDDYAPNPLPIPEDTAPEEEEPAPSQDDDPDRPQEQPPNTLPDGALPEGARQRSVPLAGDGTIRY
jgi:hypothetical protein